MLLWFTKQQIIVLAYIDWTEYRGQCDPSASMKGFYPPEQHVLDAVD